MVAAIDSDWAAPVGSDVEAFEIQVACNSLASHMLCVFQAVQQRFTLHCWRRESRRGIECIARHSPSSRQRMQLGALAPNRYSSTAMHPPGTCLATSSKRNSRSEHPPTLFPKACIVVELYGQCVDFAQMLWHVTKYGVQLSRTLQRRSEPPVAGHLLMRCCGWRSCRSRVIRSLPSPAEECS